jgi:hypothetical protein
MSEWIFGCMSEIEKCECENKLGYVIKNMSYTFSQANMRIEYSKIGYVTEDMSQ